MTESSNKPVSLFDRGHLRNDLRGKTVRGGALTAAAQIWRFVINTASTMILARLLVPEDFGVVALGVSLAGFAGVFQSFGLTSAVVQRESLTHESVSALFWINIGAVAATGGLLFLVAPPLANAFGNEELRTVIPMIAVSFFLTGCGLMHRALLQRNLRNRDLAMMQIVGSLAGATAGVLAAVLGAGYVSLLIGIIVGSAVPSLGCWIVSGWLPGRPHLDQSVKSMLGFGGAITGNSLLSYSVRNVDNLLIGGFSGDAALGIYSKAYGLLLLPLRQIQPPVSAVAVPALSSLQNDPEAYKKFYFRCIEGVLFLTMSIVAFSFAAADEIIRIVLGPGWGEAADIFRILCPAAAAGTTWIISSWAYTSLGHVKRALRVSVISTPILLVMFMLGIRWEAQGVAAALSIHSVLVAIPVIAICYKGTFLKMSDLAKAVWRPILGSVSAGLAAWSLPMLLAIQPSVIPLLIVRMVLFTVVWFGFWYALPSGRLHLRSIIDLRKHFKNPLGHKAGSSGTP